MSRGEKKRGGATRTSTFHRRLGEKIGFSQNQGKERLLLGGGRGGRVGSWKKTQGLAQGRGCFFDRRKKEKRKSGAEIALSTTERENLKSDAERRGQDRSRRAGGCVQEKPRLANDPHHRREINAVRDKDGEESTVGEKGKC